MEIHTIKFVYAGDFEERDALHHLLDIAVAEDRFGTIFVEPRDILESLKNYICDELEVDGDEYTAIPEYSELHELMPRHVENSKFYDNIDYDKIHAAFELLLKLNELDVSINFYRE